jgi:hypothetical protein
MADDLPASAFRRPLAKHQLTNPVAVNRPKRPMSAPFVSRASGLGRNSSVQVKDGPLTVLAVVATEGASMHPGSPVTGRHIVH